MINNNNYYLSHNDSLHEIFFCDGKVGTFFLYSKNRMGHYDGCVEFEFNESLHTKNNSKQRRSVSLYYHKYNLL